MIARDIVRDPATAHLTLGTAAVLQLVGGLVAYLLILGTIAYLRPDDTLARTIVAILGATLLLKASEIAVYWFESQVQSKYTVWVQNGVFLLFAAVKVAVTLSHAPLLAFVWATLAEAALVALILFIVMSRRGPTLVSLKATAERAKTLLQDSWPLILSGMVLMVQARIDQIMLGEMIGNDEVGFYSAALRIIEAAGVISTILYSSFMPTMISIRKASEKEYQERLEKFYKLNAIIAITTVSLLAAFSPWIIEKLFGESYMAAAVIMTVMVARAISF